MHEIDLSKYNIRSDLIIENTKESNLSKSYLENNVKVDYISIKKDNLLYKMLPEYSTLFLL